MYWICPFVLFPAGSKFLASTGISFFFLCPIVNKPIDYITLTGDFTMIINVLILSVAVFLVAQLLPGIRVKNFYTAILVAIVYSLINFFTGWLLVLLSLPFMIITFGLFKLVINAFMLWLTDKLMEDFKISDVLTTFIAAALITFVDSAMQWLF
jgi:putative membrane protein